MPMTTIHPHEDPMDVVAAVPELLPDEDAADPDADEWPVCPNCGSNLGDDEAPDDGTEPGENLCAACKAGLPPDPEGQNDDRALWAEAAIEAFEAETRTDREDALPDLLCELMHWCDRNGQDFDAMLSRARGCYGEETDPKGGW